MADIGQTNNERRSSESVPVQKRYLKARYVFQALRKRSGRLLVASVILALIFTGLARIQHQFVQSQVYRTTSQELASGAEQVASEITSDGKWDLKDYRNSISLPSEPPAWYVITHDGLIVDIAGFIPGIVERVQAPEGPILKGLPTAVGETWHLLQTPVEGGYVILGIPSSSNPPDPDSTLKRNAKEFGSTLTEAITLAVQDENSIKGRQIENEVDYAVISSSGELKAAWGGVPLRTDMSALPAPSDHIKHERYDGKPYLLYFHLIVDKQNHEMGTIIVPKDMSLEEQALRSQDRFNFSIVAIAGVLAIVTALVFMARELFGQAKEVTLEEALKIGESLTIEFKSTFQYDVRQKKIDPELRLVTLKSIAGLLNAEGGSLFVGVTEDESPPRVRGLTEDLDEMKGSRDRLRLTLRNLITDRIGSEYSYLITDRVSETDGKIYWVIVVKESPEPVFVRWKPKHEPKERKIFYVREGPKTSDLDNESTYHYIKHKWG
jgi:hypothetical protein